MPGEETESGMPGGAARLRSQVLIRLAAPGCAYFEAVKPPVMVRQLLTDPHAHTVGCRCSVHNHTRYLMPLVLGCQHMLVNNCLPLCSLRRTCCSACVRP